MGDKGNDEVKSECEVGLSILAVHVHARRGIDRNCMARLRLSSWRLVNTGRLGVRA
jgi:hypothetical protein